MSSSTSQKSLFLGLPIQAGLFFILLPLFTWMAATNYISHSELWAIRSGKLFGSFQPEASVIYYKGLFYGLLKAPYFISLDNWQHILIARILFGVLASFYVFLWIHMAFLITGGRRASVLFAVFLLSAHVFVYNIYRVRADLVAHIFITLALIKALTKYKAQKRALSLETILLLLCAFLSTPKAIMSYGAVLAFSYFLDRSQSLNQKWDFRTSLGLLIPFLLVGVVFSGLHAIGLFKEHPYSLALLFFQESMKNLFYMDPWSPFFQSTMINFLHYGLILWGFIWFFVKKSQMSSLQKGLILLSLLSWLQFLLYSDKWNYYMASLFPLLSLPVLLLFQSHSFFKRGALCSFLFFFLPIFMTRFEVWHVSNQAQKEIIQSLEPLLENNPNATYFDSTGLLPRFKSLPFFLGPRDKIGNQNTLMFVSEHKPEFIFYTGKMHWIEKGLKAFLLKNYQLVYPDVWVLNSFQNDFQKPATLILKQPLRELFIYDFRPSIRFYDAPVTN